MKSRGFGCFDADRKDFTSPQPLPFRGGAMNGYLSEYAEHFREGTRIRLGVPLADGGSFQEWGVVCSLQGDLLELNLSRDFLPQQATLKTGYSLDLGLVDQGAVRRCRAQVADEPEKHRLVLRLFDGVLLYEPREFFRQDVYLPLGYRLPPRQLADEVRERWRQSRWAAEFAAQSPEPGESRELEALREEIRSRPERSKAVPPVAANISGGGVRLVMAQRLWPGMLVELAVHLPHPEKALEIVGEVVQVSPVAGEARFGTALRFLFIDEADRDRLIAYITAQQLWQLSQTAPVGAARERPDGRGGRERLLAALCIAVLAAFFGCQVRSIMVKRESGEKHEIERVFDEAVAGFLRQRQ